MKKTYTPPLFEVIDIVCENIFAESHQNIDYDYEKYEW